MFFDKKYLKYIINLKYKNSLSIKKSSEKTFYIVQNMRKHYIIHFQILNQIDHA